MNRVFFKLVIFIFLLFFVFFFTHKVFRFKYGDGIYDVTKFYELDNNTVDVLILGSSHAFEHFNTGVLWDNYGMTSFTLAGSVQPMWNTYYYLKEALKTQKPELIILEGFMVTFTNEYIDDSRIIKNNYGLKWSKDKIDSIKISSPKERWAEFMFEYIQYHTRYKDISRADFIKNLGNPFYCDWKGFGCNMEVSPLKAKNISDITGTSELYGKTEEYYRKTLELAKSNNIPIAVIVSPYARINDSDQLYFNRAHDIAAEYDVAFFNCNQNDVLEAIGIDFSTDAADGDHLNFRGNIKFSVYIGNWIKENYAVSNRKGDDKYVSWQRCADYIREMINNTEKLL